MRPLVRIVPYLRRYRGTMAAAWACVVLAGIFVMVSPLLIRFAIEFGLEPIRDSNDRLTGLDGNKQLLVFGSLAIVAFAVARGLAAFGQQYLGERMGQAVAYDIRNEVYNNLQRLSYAYHDRVQTGEIMSRVTQDVENIRIFITMGALRIVYIALMLLISIAGMFIINWQLALVSIISLPIVAWRSIVTSRSLRPMWVRIQQNQARMTQVAEEGLTGIRVVKAFCARTVRVRQVRRRLATTVRT